MPTFGLEVGVYIVRSRVDDPFCTGTRATKATPFGYQGYSKATEGGYSVMSVTRQRGFLFGPNDQIYDPKRSVQIS
jgi:hypothetical protein